MEAILGLNLSLKMRGDWGNYFGFRSEFQILLIKIVENLQVNIQIQFLIYFKLF